MQKGPAKNGTTVHPKQVTSAVILENNCIRLLKNKLEYGNINNVGVK